MEGKENKRSILGVRLTDSDYQELRKVSEENSRSMSQQARYYIEQGMKAEKEGVQRNPDGSVKND